MPKTILIVSDRADETAALADMLNSEYLFLIAADASEMQRALHAYAAVFSAILVNAELSAAGAPAMLAVLRAQASKHAVPLLIAVDRSDAAGQMRALSFGASACALKPFSREALRYSLRNLIALRAQAAAAGDGTARAPSMPGIFPSIMENSNDIAFAKDVNFRYLCCSRAYARLLGLPNARAVIGRTDGELFSEEFAKRLRAEDAKLAADGVPIIDKQETIPALGGLPCYTRISKYLVRDPDGQALGIYGVGRDITRRQETSDQLKLLTDTLPMGLATFACTAEANRLVYFNARFCALVGMDGAALERGARNPMDAILPEDRPAVDARVAALIDFGAPMDCVYRVRTADGGFRWLSHRAIVADRVDGAVIVNAVLLDVTETQEEKERLRVSEELNRLAIEHSGNIITRFDVRARTLTLPDAFNPIFVLPQVLQNVPQEQIALGRISPDTAGSYAELFEGIARGQAAGSATYKQHSTKGWRWLEAQYTTVFSSAKTPVSAVISFSDITEQLEKEVVYNKWQQSLRERPAESYTLLRCNLSKGTSFESREGRLLQLRLDGADQRFDVQIARYADRCACAEDRGELLDFLNADSMLAEYYRGHRSDVLEYRERAGGDAVRWLRLTIDLVEYPGSRDIEAYLMFEDIDAQKKAELLTLERSETDPLTGILNRAAFIERMEHILHGSRRGERHALLMLDIDNFKRINDTLGHGAGDQLLRDLTRSIRSILRRDDLIGRLGGDEFFVFLKNIPGDETAARKAERICELKLRAENTDARVTASIGIAMIPRDGSDFDTLYKRVDRALYRQKERGKNGYLFASETADF